jgi:hypothetical protein
VVLAAVIIAGIFPAGGSRGEASVVEAARALVGAPKFLLLGGVLRRLQFYTQTTI